MEIEEEYLGLIYAVGAIMGWGCYGLPLKYFKVTDINPIILQFYFSVAIFLSSFLLLIKFPFYFTYLGMIGAAIITNSSIISFLAIKYAGLAIAQGTWSGLVIIISFLWGAFVFHEPISNLPLVLLGLGLIMGGVVSISLCDTQIHHHLPPSFQFLYKLNWFLAPPPEEEEEENEPMIGKQILLKKLNESSAPLVPNYNISTYRLKKEDIKVTHEFLIGIILSIIMGISTGCAYVPLQFLPSEFEGENQIIYIISFSIGMMCWSSLYLFFYILFLHFYRKSDWKKEIKIKNFGAGVLGGGIWAVANFCGTNAVIYLGMAVGFPLTQASIIVGGLCGIFVLREIKRYVAITQFFVGSFVLLGGCFLLAYYS